MAARKSNRHTGAGVAVDPFGGPVFDPTQNVKDLTEAANQRQDDLREKDSEINKLRNDCQKEVSNLRAVHASEIDSIREQHQEKLRKAEADRIDAIRQVDREDVNKTAAQVLSAVQTLATTAANTAETLRKQVADTAQAAQTTFAAANAENSKRLLALELSSSAGLGGSKGMQQMWGVIIAVVMFVVAVAAVVIALFK